MLRSCRLVTLIVALALVGSVLAPTSGAAPKPKGTNTVTCSISAGTTFTWVAGTTEITYVFRRSDNSITEQGSYFPSKAHQAGSTTITTASDAATVQATFFVKSTGGETPAFPCTA